MSAPVKLLLEGRPGVGKTTVARRLVGLLRDAGVEPRGFVTEEIRERGRRVGFRVESIAGARGTLAHVRLARPPRVGRYGVDLEAFERIALPALTPEEGGTFVIDELGKMELASEAFRESVSKLFDQPVGVVATVMATRHPFADALKRRADTELVRVTNQNRQELPARLGSRLLGAPAPGKTHPRRSPGRRSRARD